MSDSRDKPLTLATSASSGIDLELAKVLAAEGYDLALAADQPLDEAASAMQAAGGAIALALESKNHPRRTPRERPGSPTSALAEEPGDWQGADTHSV